MEELVSMEFTILSIMTVNLMKRTVSILTQRERNSMSIGTAIRDTVCRIMRTKGQGEGKGGDEFWEKAEKLLYTALIGYIYYEAPEEEQNFSTLLEMINAMEVREDDEEFKNAVDLMFEELAKKDPEHFAVRQYAKYKLAAGVIR